MHEEPLSRRKRFGQEIDDVVIETYCYRYLSGHDVEEIKQLFLSREGLLDARAEIARVARKVAG